MFSFNKKSKGSAEIQFSSNDGNHIASHGRKLWRSNEDVTGCAIFKLQPGVEFARSKIVLKGNSYFSSVYCPVLTKISKGLSQQEQTILGPAVSNGRGETRRYP